VFSEIFVYIFLLFRDYADTGVIIDRSFELLVLFIMIVTVVCAYVQTSKLDINPHPIRYMNALPVTFKLTNSIILSTVN